MTSSELNCMMDNDRRDISQRGICTWHLVGGHTCRRRDWLSFTRYVTVKMNPMTFVARPMIPTSYACGSLTSC